MPPLAFPHPRTIPRHPLPRHPRRLTPGAARLLPPLLLLLLPSLAWAQLGPNLRPPGLPADHPIDQAKVTSGEGPTDGGAWLLMGEWELNADDVVFSASKKRQLLAEAPSTIHVITDRQIERHGWRTLSEILRQVPGVQTRTWLAQYQSLMIRGLLGTEVNNTRILWLQNGVPINDIRDGGIWLDETFPVELIKRVEVVLGPGSSLYGAGAFQGVVNIFTKDPRDVPEFGEYRLGFGSSGTLKSSALGAVNLGELGLLLFASANTTQGPGLISDYRLRQEERLAGATAVRNGDSPIDPTYDPGRVPFNSGRDWQHLYLKGVYKGLRASVGFSNIQAGFDGAEFFPATRYKFNRQELSSEVVFEGPLSNSISVLGLLSYRFYRNDYTDYFDLDLETVVKIQAYDDVLTDPRYPSRLDEKVTYVTDQHKLFSIAQMQWRLFTTNELIVGLGGRFEAIAAPEFQSDKVNQSFINGSVFLQDEQRLFDNNLILTAGIRLDTHREFGPQLSFRAAGLVKWSRWLVQRLSYGTAFKEPAMSQLYIDHFNAKGNPDLDAETLHNVELSTVIRPFERVTLRLDAFATWMDNLILNEFDARLGVPYLGIDGKFVSFQENAARILGFEVSTRAELFEGLSLFAHYNFLDSRTRRCPTCDFQRLDYDAMHRAGLGLTWLTNDLVGSIALYYIGETTDTEPSLPGEEVSDSTQEAVPHYLLIQPNLRVRLPGNLGAMVQASYAISEGMTQAPSAYHYYEMAGVPVPRLSFLASLIYPYQ